MILKIAPETGNNVKNISGVDISFYKIIRTDNLWQEFTSTALEYFKADYESTAFRKTCFDEKYLSDNADEIFKSFGNSFAVVFSQNRYFIFVISQNGIAKIVPGESGEFRRYNAIASVLKLQFSLLLKTPSS